MRASILLLSLSLIQCGSGVLPKTPLRGLINMGDISFYNKTDVAPVNDPALVQPFASSFKGIVINVTWDQLQPDGPTPLADNNPIDQALETIRSYNLANPAFPLMAKLRVWGGFVAPDWAKALNGGPINVAPVNPNSGKSQSGSIGLFWTPSYIAAWRYLQCLLATRYDDEPLIVEVGITSCASDTDEPFVAWLDQPTVDILHGFGYSDAQQESCLRGALDDYSCWEQTFIDFPFSLFHDTDALPVKADPTFTAQVMDQCAAAPTCIMSNHALNEPLSTPDDIVYTTMQSLYAANPTSTLIDFQTAAPAILDWCGAIENAVALHGASVEVWPEFGGFTTLSADQVANLAQAFEDQATPDPALCPSVP